MENRQFIGDLPIQTVIFHSHVKLPEGNTSLKPGMVTSGDRTRLLPTLLRRTAPEKLSMDHGSLEVPNSETSHRMAVIPLKYSEG